MGPVKGSNERLSDYRFRYARYSIRWVIGFGLARGHWRRWQPLQCFNVLSCFSPGVSRRCRFLVDDPTWSPAYRERVEVNPERLEAERAAERPRDMRIFRRMSAIARVIFTVAMFSGNSLHRYGANGSTVGVAPHFAPANRSLQSSGVTNMLRTFLIALAFLPQGVAAAGIVPAPAREALLKQALEGFWGRAKTADGKPIQPESEAERRTLPVNEKVANFAFDVGELSGLAEWCGIEWKPNFAALTRHARNGGQSERQVAFISVVHGVAQGSVASAMAKSGPCSAQHREKVRMRVDAFLSREPK